MDPVEKAFKKGYKLAADRARAFHPRRIENDTAHMEAQWAGYKLHMGENK